MSSSRDHAPSITAVTSGQPHTPGRRTHDFRRSTWGHTMHGSTWRAVDDQRVSVMVHVSPSPQVGDSVIYAASSGIDRHCTVVAVKPCGDPRDMFTLTLEETPDTDTGTGPLEGRTGQLREDQ